MCYSVINFADNMMTLIGDLYLHVGAKVEL